jgi:hypothetical protein
MNTKKILGLALISSGLLLAAPVFAGTIVVDNFSVNQGPIEDTTKDGQAATNTLPIRTLTHNLLDFSAPTNSGVEVAGGALDIQNGSGENSEVTVSWVLNGGIVPAGSTNVAFNFGVNQSDGNPTSMQFLFNNQNLSSFSIPINIGTDPNITPPVPVKFGLTQAQLLTLNNGGKLDLIISGAKGWDLNLDQFDITFDPSNVVPNVPEPSVLALITISLLGLGFLGKRKQHLSTGF